MRILQINGVIHQGSTGAIVDDICACSLENGDDCIIAYGIGDKTADGFKFCYRYEQALYRRCSMITGYRYGFAPLSTMRVKKLIEVYNPDVVHIHSINGNCINIFKTLEYLKKKNIVTVITNHAEFFYTGNCTSSYGCKQYLTGCCNCNNKKWASDSSILPKTDKAWQRMKKAFDGFNHLHVVSVSKYSLECSKKSPILSQYNHSVIFNGINTKIFSFSRDIDIRKKYNLTAKRIAVFVASGFSIDKDHLKGGYWLVELAKRYECADFQFLVVGSNGENVQQDNVVFAGRVNESRLLANIYSQSDIALGFSKSESFGMTCAESLCCGTPFVGFKCGGTESIAIEEFSRFAEYGDLDEIEKGINDLINRFIDKKRYISETSKIRYSSYTMAREYNNLYRELLYLKQGEEA